MRSTYAHTCNINVNLSDLTKTCFIILTNMFHKEICFDYELVPLSMASHLMFYNESKSARV